MHIELLQVLSDPTRLRIVEVLRSGECPVNDIVESVCIDQSGVSRHLRILHKAGFVRVRPEGQKRFYSLCPGPFKDLAAWVSEYRRLWEGRLDKFGEALVRKRQVKESVFRHANHRGEHHERKSKQLV